MIKLYTDGSAKDARSKKPHGGGRAGWGFVIVDDETVLVADMGSSVGCSEDGELLAILNGLLALTTPTEVEIVTDCQSAQYLANVSLPCFTIEQLTRGHVSSKPYKRRCNYLKRAIRGLCMFHTVKITLIPRMVDQWAIYADTLARRAIGLLHRSKLVTATKRIQQTLRRKTLANCHSIADYEKATGETFIVNKKNRGRVTRGELTIEQTFKIQVKGASRAEEEKKLVQEKAGLPTPKQLPKFVFTGRLDALSRDTAKYLATAGGFTVARQVTKCVTHLIVGDKPSNRQQNIAQTLGVKFLDEQEFLNFLGNPSILLGGRG